MIIITTITNIQDDQFTNVRGNNYYYHNNNPLEVI